ncbi:MAG: TonB-dependent receptor [Mangrovibacterium sp.]
MRFFVFTALCCALLCGNLFAQDSSLSDTIQIEEVQTIAPYRKFQAGAKIVSVPKEQLEISQTESLDKLLSRFSPIYIKSDAGGLSSIRLRGTAPDHTSVNFGGINVNSLTLGSTNASNIPMYLFDGIDLQYGSSAAINGSGAIGGAVYLGLNNRWTDGTKANARISQGSFGEQLYGTKIFLGNGKLESVTRAYYYSVANDFPFTYEDKEYNQKNASLEHYGLLQEINYKFHEQAWWKTAVWLQSNYHENAMSMASHQAENDNKDNTNDKFIRIWSEYENRKGEIDFKAGLGYVKDKQIPSENTAQEIGTNRLIAELEAAQDILPNLGYKVGVKYRYINPEVYAYSKEVIDYEQQADFYALLFYSMWNKCKLTLNMRQQFVSNFNAPFTPTLGTEYRVLTTNHSLIKLMGNVAYSYRVPTFNDRFWGSQGNPNLQAEQGLNYELGAYYAYCSEQFTSEININAFYMDVDNWIEWRPGNGGLWVAENRANVVSKGLEFQLKNTLKLSNWDLSLFANYSLNPTEVKEDEITGRIGKPLLYSPKHNANAYFSAKYLQWLFFVSGTYTGERLVDYNASYLTPVGNRLDAYTLLDAGITRKLKIRKQGFALSFACNNLLDKDYINQVGYAMPGRSFRLTLSIDLAPSISPKEGGTRTTDLK